MCLVSPLLSKILPAILGKSILLGLSVFPDAGPFSKAEKGWHDCSPGRTCRQGKLARLGSVWGVGDPLCEDMEGTISRLGCDLDASSSADFYFSPKENTRHTLPWPTSVLLSSLCPE